jgi:hypothetical protein
MEWWDCYSVYRLNKVQNDILIIRDYLPTPIGAEFEEQEVKPGGRGPEKTSPTPIGVECEEQEVKPGGGAGKFPNPDRG